MSDLTYDPSRERTDKPVVWLSGKITTPPFSRPARLEAGQLLRLVQQGKPLGLPHSRPMPVIGPHCHELRIHDARVTWRIVYRIDPNAVVIAGIFKKKTRTTPAEVIKATKRRFSEYDDG